MNVLETDNLYSNDDNSLMDEVKFQAGLDNSYIQFLSTIENLKDN